MTHPFPTRRSADLREGRFVLTVQDSHGHAAGVRTSLPTLAHSLPTLRRPSGAIDSMFLFRSNRAMSRVDDDTLALHLEVALSTAMPSLLDRLADPDRSEEHTSELQSLMRISYAVFCLKKKKHNQIQSNY